MTTTHGPTEGTSLALTPRQERLVALRDDMQPGGKPGAIVPRTFLETEVMCKALATAGLIPAAYKDRPTDMIVVVMSGAELGLAPMASLRLYHIIEGVPRIGAEGIRSIILAHPSCEYFEFAESTESRSTWIGKRRGRPERAITWTIERAERAGLIRKTRNGEPNTWMKFPEDMLNARASGQLGRLIWPDVTAGLISREEAMDGAIDAEWTEAPRQTFVAPQPGPIVAGSYTSSTGQPAIPAAGSVLTTDKGERVTVMGNGVQAPTASEPRRRGRPPAEKPPEQSTQGPSPKDETKAPDPDAQQGVVLDKWGQAVGQVEAKKSASGLVLNDVIAATDANPTPAASAVTSSPTESASSTASSTASSSSADTGFDDPVDEAPVYSQAAFESWLLECKTQGQMAMEAAPWVRWNATIGDPKISDPKQRPEVKVNQKLYAERKAKLPA